MPVRLTEVNSISGGGLDGTSNVFAAALWTADLAFEYAKAGVESISMHWGVGGGPDGFQSTPSYAAVRTGFGKVNAKNSFPGDSNPAPQVGVCSFILHKTSSLAFSALHTTTTHAKRTHTPTHITNTKK